MNPSDRRTRNDSDLTFILPRALPLMFIRVERKERDAVSVHLLEFFTLMTLPCMRRIDSGVKPDSEQSLPFPPTTPNETSLLAAHRNREERPRALKGALRAQVIYHRQCAECEMQTFRGIASCMLFDNESGIEGTMTMMNEVVE